MLVADSLSRACLREVNSCIFVRELEEVDHSTNLSVSDERWQQLTHVLVDDPHKSEAVAHCHSMWLA